MRYRFRHVMVITYGRSGSTLLMGLLNAIPGACVRGENGGALNHLHAAVRAVERTAGKGRGEGQEPTSPWYGAPWVQPAAFRDEVVSAFMRDVLCVPAEAELIGFKEVRYERTDFEDPSFEDFLRFLRQTFADVCFVFNVRRHTDVAKSAWWAEDRLAHRELAAIERRFRAAADRHADISYWVSYDRSVAEPETLRGLYEFLGVPFDLERVKAVMAVNHSYWPTGQAQADSLAQRSLWRAVVWRLGRHLLMTYRPRRHEEERPPYPGSPSSG